MSDVIYAGCDCRLTDEQKDLVNPFWFSIGRAYLFREDNYPCIIYNAHNERVGFIIFSKWLANGDAYSWSYFIDKGVSLSHCKGDKKNPNSTRLD